MSGSDGKRLDTLQPRITHLRIRNESPPRGVRQALWGKVKPAAFYCGLLYSNQTVKSCYDFRNDEMAGSSRFFAGSGRR